MEIEPEYLSLLPRSSSQQSRHELSSNRCKWDQVSDIKMMTEEIRAVEKSGQIAFGQNK